MGLLRSGDVVTYRVEFPEQMREGRELAHEIRAYSRDSGLRWFHPLPPMVLRSEDGPDGRPRMIQDGAVTVDARHGTVVWTRTRCTEIVTLDADGNENGRRTLDRAIYRPFVAADGHVWVHVRAPSARNVSSWLVLDRDLDVVRRVAEAGVRDAWGDYALTLSFDDTGLQLLTLLRARRQERFGLVVCRSRVDYPLGGRFPLGPRRLHSRAVPSLRPPANSSASARPDFFPVPGPDRPAFIGPREKRLPLAPLARQITCIYTWM